MDHEKKKPKKSGFAWCSAINCSNNSGMLESKYSFFSFPKDPIRCREWVIRSRRLDLEDKSPSYLHNNCKLCSMHFENIMFLNFLKNRLHKHAVPSLFDVPNPPPCVASQRKPPKERRENLKPSFGGSTVDTMGGGGCEKQELTIRKSPGFPEAAKEVIVTCFVCSQPISPGFAVHLNVPAVATKIILQKHLETILNMIGGMTSHEVVCRRCSSLLNYIDRTEEELKKLKEAISTCSKGKGKGVESEPEVKKSVQFLDRFSRGLGDKNYVMPLEDLFSLKSEKDVDLEVNAAESVKVGDTSHNDVQHSRDDIAKVFMKNDVDSRKYMDEVASKIHRNVSGAIETSDVSSSSEIVLTKKSNIGVSEEKSDAGRKEEPVTTAYVVKNISSHLGYIGKSLGTQHMKNKWRRIAPKTCHPFGESDSVLEVGEGSSVIAEHGIQRDIRTRGHVCQICSFETIHHSVMIWHLRLHLKKGRWCDYCTDELPEQVSSLVHSEGSVLHCNSSIACVGSNDVVPALIESEVPDYPVVEVESCSERFYKNVCKICSFKTDYDSVMIWHLRMHMKTCWQCDYCSENIPGYYPPRQSRSKLCRKSVSKKIKAKDSTKGRMNDKIGCDGS